MSARTIEGIYSLEGDTLRLCYDMGPESKRPGGFVTEKGSQQVLVVLKRTQGREVFPYRLPDGTRAFPRIIEEANPMLPQIVPQPPKASKPNYGNYDSGFASPGTVQGGERTANPEKDKSSEKTEPKAPKLGTLEGELKVHPKYLYRYYLVLRDGQKCPLYGSDHAREPAQLTRLKLPIRVRVRGVLGTSHHPGGTKENPSPFPETWTLYMDVHEIEALK